MTQAKSLRYGPKTCLRSCCHLILAGFLSTGCTLKDLRHDLPFQDEGPRKEGLGPKAHRHLENAAIRLGYDDWKDLSMTLELEDDWTSSFMRWVATPLDEDVGVFTVSYDTKVAMTTFDPTRGLDTPGRRIVTENRLERWEGDERENLGDGKAFLYFDGLRFYLDLAFRLMRPKGAMFAGMKDRRGRSYVRVFAWLSGDGTATPEHDQYIIWIDSKTGLPRFVEFTYRKLMTSYAGTLRLGRYVRYGNMRFPTLLCVGSSVESSSCDHTLKVSIPNI